MAGYKTNEREGTRAVLRHARVSPYKVREVLDLVRGKPVHEAEDILRFSDRDAAFTVGKVLHSAVANAENNDELDPEELYVASCFADEGTTIKRWRPRARGRATRIRKRTSHITVIVGRMPVEELQRQQARRRAEQLAQRARRVAGARRAEGDQRPRAERRHGGPALEEPEAELLDEAPVADTDAAEDAGVTGEPDEVEAGPEDDLAGDAAGDEAAGDEAAGDEDGGDEAAGDEDGGEAAPVEAGETAPATEDETPSPTSEDETTEAEPTKDEPTRADPTQDNRDEH
jgi:large subunit ribosomal protein L22